MRIFPLSLSVPASRHLGASIFATRCAVSNSKSIAFKCRLRGRSTFITSWKNEYLQKITSHFVQGTYFLFALFKKVNVWNFQVKGGGRIFHVLQVSMSWFVDVVLPLVSNWRPLEWLCWQVLGIRLISATPKGSNKVCFHNFTTCHGFFAHGVGHGCYYGNTIFKKKASGQSGVYLTIGLPTYQQKHHFFKEIGHQRIPRLSNLEPVTPRWHENERLAPHTMDFDWLSDSLVHSFNHWLFVDSKVSEQSYVWHSREQPQRQGKNCTLHRATVMENSPKVQGLKYFGELLFHASLLPKNYTAAETFWRSPHSKKKEQNKQGKHLRTCVVFLLQ